MAKKPRVSVTNETETGRNTNFIDNKTGIKMTRAAFVKKIKQGEYQDYYYRKQGDLETPVSKPDGDESNNLG